MIEFEREIIKLMHKAIAEETALLNKRESELKVFSEVVKKIPVDFRLRIVDLFKADDLNFDRDWAAVILRRQVLVNFIKEEYKIHVPIDFYHLKKQDSKDIKQNVRNYTAFIQQSLELLRDLSHDYGINPYEYIEGLIKERFIFINGADANEEVFLTSTEFKAKLKNENSKLFIKLAGDGRYTNVYEREREPYSCDFVDMCMEEASKRIKFGEKYKQLGHTRKQLVKYIADNSCVVIGNGAEVKENRGRIKRI